MTTAQPPAYNDNCANKKQPYEAFSNCFDSLWVI